MTGNAGQQGQQGQQGQRGGAAYQRPFPHPTGARPPAIPADLVPQPRGDRHGRQRPVGQPTRGLPRTKGHEAGEAALLDVVAGAIELGIPHLSAYAFSTENWRRSPDEVRFLMGFNRDVIRRRRDQLNSWGVRMRWVGRRPAPVAVSDQRAWRSLRR
jgi:undecaprenyl diphosphate synthase